LRQKKDYKLLQRGKSRQEVVELQYKQKPTNIRIKMPPIQPKTNQTEPITSTNPPSHKGDDL